MSQNYFTHRTKIYFTIAWICMCCMGAQNTMAQFPGWHWAKSYGGADEDDNAASVSTDANGNVFLAGNFYSPSITFGHITLTNPFSGNTTPFFFLVKYDSTGNVLWAKSAYAFANHTAVDQAGNVYLTGTFRGTLTVDGNQLFSNNNSDIFLLKYNPAGTLLWLRDVGGIYSDSPGDVKTDANNNLYLTGTYGHDTLTIGSIQLPNNGVDDIFLAKYDSAGNVLWARGAGGANSEYGKSVSIDSDGNCYLAGGFSSPSITLGSVVLTNTLSPQSDMYLAKYDAAGNVLWAKSAGGNHAEGVNDLLADSWGGVYVAGYFYSQSFPLDTFTLLNDTTTITPDLFLAKFDTAGSVMWAKRAGGNESDYCSAMAIDMVGQVFIAGQFRSPVIYFDTIALVNQSVPGPSDFFVVKYSPSGNVLWARREGGNPNETIAGIATDSWGSIYVCGGFWGFLAQTLTLDTIVLPGYGFNDLFFAKMKEFVSGIPEINQEHHFNIYPNPGTGRFSVETETHSPHAFEKLEAYNMMGEKVFQLKINPDLSMAAQQEFTVDFSDLPKGVYVVVLSNKEVFAIEKLIIQ